ncbi:MAG TPA: BON domain-containing protein [Vicinamibacterales bacterium]|jgi:hyperosmotically inducible periplasmic protein|nr:BON domain-containing protein [Vicinamibacterales bacterium]
MIPRLLLLMCLVSAALPACGGGTSIRTMNAGAMDDATITARVKTALLNDQQISATKIDVTTTNGVVTISGTVRNRADEQRAIELARQTPGVKDVKSTLQTGS